MFNATGISPFRGKINRFIIPLAHYQGLYKTPKQTDTVVVADSEPEYKSYAKVPTAAPDKKVESTPTPNIKIDKAEFEGGVSSLSISSIQLKKEANKKASSKIKVQNEAQETFDQETLSEHWQVYVDEKNKQGENNIAALLEMSKPVLAPDHKILLKASNELSKVELTKELPILLEYLSKVLNNFKITFEIDVALQKNEEYIYGAKEKFEYLKKINPKIEELRNEFDLDV